MREYEKAKVTMINTDLANEIDENGMMDGSKAIHEPKRSPFMSFVRSTNGKKLYFKDEDQSETH